MKVSQELSISFRLRKSKSETNGKRTIMLRLVIRGERDDVSLGYQVNPAKFCKKSGIINGSFPEVIEINKAIAKTRTDILYHYNRLKDEGDDAPFTFW
ncbi:Arm DNA-binding domain-containing protein [Chitinophaga horti]|uniref:Arm DNA-binding domain-containing protein n=1 Tax=Chitinophaga horti TaxID=2920382 RepID=A0ABY6J7L5_9BACT|nr:Arm DNA-binding domain-containing protein [Chitinophaga horti]UYQ95674.1 Arm DNA-binding domain-containing protein [Chitinophaga horti]